MSTSRFHFYLSIYIYIPGSEVPRTVATLFYLTGSACRLSAYVRAAERQSYNPGQNGRPCYLYSSYRNLGKYRTISLLGKAIAANHSKKVLPVVFLDF
jgi:hypothetical protein